MHGHLLLHAGQRNDRIDREDFDLRDARGFEIELHALRNPVADQLVIRLADIGPHAADVRDRAGRLEQHQALIGRGAIESPRADVVGQGPVIVTAGRSRGARA